MKVKDGIKYYTITEAASLIGRSSQMVRLWANWSDEREAEGLERFIPPHTTFGKKPTRYWSEYEVAILANFANNKENGIMKEYSFRIWGKRYKKKDETLEEILADMEEEYKEELKIVDDILRGD